MFFEKVFIFFSKINNWFSFAFLKFEASYIGNPSFKNQNLLLFAEIKNCLLPAKIKNAILKCVKIIYLHLFFEHCFFDNWFYVLANANFGVPVNHCFYCVLLQSQNCMFLTTYKFQKIETVWFFNGFEIFQTHMKNDSKKHWNTEPKTLCLPLFSQHVHRERNSKPTPEIPINRNHH